MPFTFSHPAIVLPFYRFVKPWVSLTGLVIGSVVPDFEYFIRMKIPSIYSHTLLGLLTFNLPVGLLLCFLFHNVVRNTLFSHLPHILHSRISKYKRFNWNQYFRKKWYLVVLSILIGAVSHLFWDSFVHENGYLPTIFSLFNQKMETYDIEMTEYKTLHQLSTIIGGIIVLYAIFQLPVTDRIKRPFFYKFWIYVLLIMIAVLIIRFNTGLSTRDYQEVIVNIVSGFLIGIVAMSIYLRKDYY